MRGDSLHDDEFKEHQVPATRSRNGATCKRRSSKDTGANRHDKLKALGPGLVTGASDDDPSGIATYAQTGAQFGFAMLWVALLTYPLMAGVQEICDRTALATGKGLGELIVLRFSRRWRLVIGILIGLLIVANVLNIAADLMAIGAGMNLLHAGPPLLWSLLAGAILIAHLVTGSFGFTSNILKFLCVALLAYGVVLFFIKIPWVSVFL